MGKNSVNKKTKWILGLLLLIFFSTGGLIDYWQSATQHNLAIPVFLKDYFALFWLILYSGVLPFLLVFTASNFNLRLARFYLGFALLGMVIWDLTFSLLDQHILVSDQPAYWFWGKTDYPLAKVQILIWHFIRSVFGMFLIFKG